MDPLAFDTWICFLVSIPVFTGVMCLLNYLYGGNSNWEESGSFVLRNAFVEHADMPDKYLYQKCLVWVWSLMTWIIMCGYAGSLTAFITKPGVNLPFSNVEGLVKQTEYKWAVTEGSIFTPYAKENFEEGSVMRTLIDQAQTFEYGVEWADNDCFTAEGEKAGDIASICDYTAALFAQSNDFSKTSKCNYFLTKDKFLPFYMGLAFQVGKSLVTTSIYVICFAEGEPLLG